VVGSCHAARLMAFVTWMLDQAGDQGIEASWAYGSATDWCHATGLSAAQLEAAMIRLEDLRLLVFVHGFVGGRLFMLIGPPMSPRFPPLGRGRKSVIGSPYC
jgi:hypothetical protein